MASPGSTNRFSHCLKPLQKPMVWIPFGVSALLCLLVWQYYRQADWSVDPSITDLPPTDASAAEPSLGPRSNTLELLVEGAGGDRLSGTTPGSRGSDLDLSSDLPSDLRLSEPTDSSNTQRLDPGESSVGSPSENNLAPNDLSPGDPFANYRSEYQFPAGANVASDTLSTSPGQAGQRPSASPSRFNFEASSDASSINPVAPNTRSALSEALRRQADEKARDQLESASEGRAPSLPASELPVASPAMQPLSGANQPSFRPGSGPSPRPEPLQSPRSSSPPPQLVAPFPSAVSPPPPAAPESSDTGAPVPLYTAPTFSQPDQGRSINPRQ